MKTVITNGIIITMNRDMDMYPEGYVVLEDSRISEVGPMEALEHLSLIHIEMCIRDRGHVRGRLDRGVCNRIHNDHSYTGRHQGL